jgi:hypothetical protein
VHAINIRFAAPRVLQSRHVHLYYYYHRNRPIFLRINQTFLTHGIQANSAGIQATPTTFNPTAAAARKAESSRGGSREAQRIHCKASAFPPSDLRTYGLSIRSSIHYSDRYTDDEYEYRHVILPKPLFKMIPKSYFNPDDHGVLRLLSEPEWRGIGITQSLGWEHYEVHGTFAACSLV